MRRSRLVVAAGALALAACAGPPAGDPSPAAVGDPTTLSPSEWSGNTLDVPADFPTIQSAVDASQPGDLVLVAPGIYRETVDVKTPGITIRGVDRNDVVIDGEFERANGIQALFTDGVVVENLTTRNHTVNGVFWSGVRGYRASYVTAVNNGDYGIYAFDSGDGLFEHSYATGSPDAAYYIGQCNPCDAVITDSVGEYSGLGYSGSNASTNLYLVNNVFRYNGTGISPNSWDGELLPPVENVTVVGNLIHDNGYEPFAFKNAQWTVQGNGMALTGARDFLVARNLVLNHPMSGIYLHPLIDKNVWMTGGNTIVDNVVDGVGLAGLTMSGPAQSGTCFENNTITDTMPPAMQFKQACEGLRFPALFEIGSLSALLGRAIEANMEMTPDLFYGDLPQPAPQPQLPGGAEAPVAPAVDVFAGAEPDIQAIALPARPAGLEVTQEKGLNIMGVTFASTIGGFLGLYAYVLPLALYATWVVIAIWELITRREDLSRGAVVGWMFGILAVPFLGVVGYYIFGRSRIPAAYRWVLLAGGMGVYLVFLVLGLFVGGIV